MGVDYTAKSGFGYKISCEEVANMPFEDEDFDKGEKCELPEGFKYLRVGSSYEENEIELLIVINCDLSEILRGEKPLPDVSLLLEWAKKHGISFENEKPELYTELYIW